MVRRSSHRRCAGGAQGSPFCGPAKLPEPITIERIERALVYAAYVVVRYGPQFAPIVERLEHELEAAKKSEDAVAHARQILAVLGDKYPKEAGR